MKSPASILFDISGIPTAVSASAQPTSGALGQVMAGFDATNSVRYASFDGASLRVSGSVTANQGGNWNVLQSGTWSVTASGDVGVLKQDTTTRELIVTGSTIVVRGNDGAADRTIFTDSTGRTVITGSVIVRGNDGTTDRTLLTDATGRLFVSGSATVVRGNDGSADRTLLTDATGRLFVSGSTIVVRGNDGTTDRNLLTDATGRLFVSGSTFLARGNDGTADRTLLTDTTGRLFVSGSTFLARGNDGTADRTLFTDTTGRLFVSGSTFLARGNDGTADRNLLTDVTGKLQVSIASGSAGIVSVLTGSQIASLTDRALVVHISPNQQPIPTSLVPETATPGSSVGRASGLTANTFVPVRQTTYVEQTTQAQRSIVSTSANDSSAGTGARTVRLTYYDATGAGPFTETITLNGLTAVNTTNTNICFVEEIMVMTVGSNGSNVGTLNLYTGTGATGTIFAAVGLGAIATGVGDNRTFYAHHYIPPGKSLKGYIVTAGIVAAAGGGSSVTVMRYRDPTSTASPWQVVSDFINAAQGNSLIRPYSVSIELPGPAVVAAFTTPANNNSTATCSFDWSESSV